VATIPGGAKVNPTIALSTSRLNFVCSLQTRFLSSPMCGHQVPVCCLRTELCPRLHSDPIAGRRPNSINLDWSSRGVIGRFPSYFYGGTCFCLRYRTRGGVRAKALVARRRASHGTTGRVGVLRRPIVVAETLEIGVVHAATEPSTNGVLTAREREVPKLVAQGRTNRETADALVLSPRTVKRHVDNIFDKLGGRGVSRSSRGVEPGDVHGGHGRRPPYRRSPSAT
jgi:DNA-binding CsgD family transcriptional regulator